MIARWHIAAKFGHTSELFRLLKEWHTEVFPSTGLSAGVQYSVGVLRLADTFKMVS